MRMSRAAIVALALTCSAACFDESGCFNQTQTQGPSAIPSPSPSASPSASPVATVACSEYHVFASSYGWSGPADAVRPPNQAQPYPLCPGCESLLTATLKGAQGDVPFAIASGKGRPVWTLDAASVGLLDIDPSLAATSRHVTAANNPDGYNLLVKPRGAVGSAATVHVVVNALCVGKPPSADFKYLLTAS